MIIFSPLAFILSGLFFPKLECAGRSLASLDLELPRCLLISLPRIVVISFFPTLVYTEESSAPGMRVSTGKSNNGHARGFNSSHPVCACVRRDASKKGVIIHRRQELSGFFWKSSHRKSTAQTAMVGSYGFSFFHVL